MVSQTEGKPYKNRQRKLDLRPPPREETKENAEKREGHAGERERERPKSSVQGSDRV